VIRGVCIICIVLLDNCLYYFLIVVWVLFAKTRLVVGFLNFWSCYLLGKSRRLISKIKFSYFHILDVGLVIYFFMHV
jgi:hypothetical protein